jgi:hypothetical protein
MLDKAVKLAAILALLMAGFGVLHYYFVYLPGFQEKQRAVAAVEQRKRDMEISQVKSKFNICTITAKNDYNGNWDDYCESRKLKKDCPLPQQVLDQFSRIRENALRHCEVEAKVNLD